MRRIGKILLTLNLFTVLLCSRAKADEGMWIPMLLKYNIEDMQKKGFRLTEEDLYSINNSSLKDAIVNIRGCTGEIVSDRGLMLTNHHCGLNQIQYHSSVENDYLRNGFWADSPDEELPSPNMEARIVVRIDDLTSEILGKLSENIDESERTRQIDSLKEQIISGLELENKLYAYSISEMFGGNMFLLFTYEVFKDVRLVGAPPSDIGKFGHETDNWIWPRHTGDFCMFRIYADRDNKPATYSSDNVPYRPKYHFKISLDGVGEGDFTFIYGFPGRTNEYVPSYALENVVNETNPRRIGFRTIRLNLMKEFMDQDDNVRIQYTAKRASVANSWKRWQGESLGLGRLDAVGKKKEFERRFAGWLNENDVSKKRYGHLLPEFQQLYSEIIPYNKMLDYYNEALMAVEIFTPIASFYSLISMYEKGMKDSTDYMSKQKELKAALELFYKNYHLPYDVKLFETIIKEFENNVIPADADMKALFAECPFSNMLLTMDLIDLDDDKAKAIKSDAMYRFYSSVFEEYDKIQPDLKRINGRLAVLQREYIAAVMKMDSGRIFYPDANSTLRVAYGKVAGFRPVDGVIYDYYTTLDGVMEKNSLGNKDYQVPERLITLWKNRDYGRYARKDGTMPVAFIATNHTTGGNSGSPLLNAKGELVGLNFDRCWESTMSDYMFDPDYCRNISVDIRYVLFII
ncbi:MAG: S46 family peptidase, partial [Prevotellaceae bacterium]|nr:S46 family peptidase [Prevotellaceae bacterium]